MLIALPIPVAMGLGAVGAVGPVLPSGVGRAASNIISRLGHGTAIDLAGTTFHYIVLEYLSGGDMAALSRSHPLPLEKTLFYTEQVCSGLARA